MLAVVPGDLLIADEVVLNALGSGEEVAAQLKRSPIRPGKSERADDRNQLVFKVGDRRCDARLAEWRACVAIVNGGENVERRGAITFTGVDREAVQDI